MNRLRGAEPREVAGHTLKRIVQLATGDGTKFFLDDGSWLLVRLSGTEPLVRVYTETRAEAEVTPLLDAGERMVGGKE